MKDKEKSKKKVSEPRVFKKNQEEETNTYLKNKKTPRKEKVKVKKEKVVKPYKTIANHNAKIVLTSIFFVIALLISIIYSLYFFSNDNKDNITYKEESDVKYQVCLKNNGFFNDKCLDSSKTFVSELIDYINVDFSDIIYSNKKLDENYTYTLTSQVKATSKEDVSKVLYDKTEKLDNKTNVSKKTGSYANTTVIHKSIKIKYDDYNKVINEFKKNYVLSLDAKLILTFDIKYNGKYTDDFDKISLARTQVIEIPLSEQTVAISSQNNGNDNRYKSLYSNKHNSMDLILIPLLYLITLGSGLIIGFYALKKIPYKKEYVKKLESILKEYDRAIVTVKNLPNLTGHDKIEISTFEELLDARENLEKPILFTQSQNGDISTFCIVTDKEAYIYVLTIDYTKKDK